MQARGGSNSVKVAEAMNRFTTILFANKYATDERHPITSFSFGDDGAVWELMAPDVGFWLQLLLLAMIQTGFHMFVLSSCVYYGIVRRRGTTTAFLLGWGVIMPCSLAFPFWLIQQFDLVNTVLRLSLSTVPTIGIFRTIEAMYNTSPTPIVEASWRNHRTYWSCLHHFEWMTIDVQKQRSQNIRRKIDRNELVRNTYDVLVSFTALSILLSVSIFYNYQPFSSPVDLLSFQFHSTEIFAPAHLANSYCLVMVVYLALKLLFELNAWQFQVMEGVVTKPVFRNPLWASTGPRDFWSRRWNLMIHRVLKHGVYFPVMGKANSTNRSSTTTTATLVTFAASGLLHEISWALMGIGIPGKVTAFFVWNGVLVALEPVVIGPVMRFLLRRKCPVWVVSTVAILLALPVAQWYTGDWAWGGVLDDLKVGLWIIRPRVSG